MLVIACIISNRNLYILIIINDYIIFAGLLPLLKRAVPP